MSCSSFFLAAAGKWKGLGYFPWYFQRMHRRFAGVGIARDSASELLQRPVPAHRYLLRETGNQADRATGRKASRADIHSGGRSGRVVDGSLRVANRRGISVGELRGLLVPHLYTLSGELREVVVGAGDGRSPSLAIGWAFGSIQRYGSSPSRPWRGRTFRRPTSRNGCASVPKACCPSYTHCCWRCRRWFERSRSLQNLDVF